MKKLQFFLFLVLVTQFTTAQDKVVQLKGAVSSTVQEVVGVYVLNRTNNKGAVTNENGSFSIPVRLKDTIEFSAVQFKNKQIIITQKILDLKSYIINLDETLEELDEVVLDQRTQVTAMSLGLVHANVKTLELAERELISGTTMSFDGIKNSLDPVINYLSGRTKMLKERVARDKRYTTGQKMQQKYLDSITLTKLKIPEAKLQEFVLYCEQDEDFDAFMSQPNDVFVKAFFKMKAKSFLKEKK
ncbi:carboxypeptidase-like regulatory domain-containing protein [Cellulophaga sp. 20_2_10]|uniref:carboxypeptidase-like regulatory domain-containing protein n=1 Tax=Cellulophaga sp. 20_2_10 TaxID=2942476 RepID=UPI00201AA17D|nr:carboxypeptidase-like regulatory domain-containing protein [Cellulophaga sp. 20_2_10]MCL5247090.1 carboxypeptidase-like regulatory domain-containing protein [Cellulophaga sp. 20_2_10]